MSIKAFFRDLFAEPADFRDDAYGYLTNQVGHVFFGATIPMFVIGLSYYSTGRYPDQIPIVINFVLSYLIGWELMTQGFRGLDTLLDTLFVAVGTSLYIIVEMDIVLDRLLVAFALVYVGLLWSTYRIWKRQPPPLD